MENAVIALKGIKKNYGKNKVLTGIDMQVRQGDIYGLVGKNGAGKTTIFKIILGLSDSSGGELCICGGSSRKALAEGRRRIGFFVGSNFFPYLNARGNLKYYCRLKGIRDANEIERVLKIVELDKTNTPYSGYSLGMRQRLGIANALLGNPEILILDEPTNGLDPQGIADIRRLVRQLNEDYGITVIISSHILGELQNTAHRFGIVNQGVIVKELSTEDLKNASSVVRIEVDDMERAQAALQAAGVKILSAKEEAGSLEELYFDLVGGKGSDNV